MYVYIFSFVNGVLGMILGLYYFVIVRYDVELLVYNQH